ncbi:hypothetical protein DXT99_10600 [Pontibacter diazotrophicus]|uniref:Uncharacterized protein n=1 Tax=Pontibacter diazotrophicus TaxID=1400979 RepID=A0A3D8LCV7_9BACT|nr:hypothetical protein [Pontibacter diazotrophicus]RDV15114.1 hypothetical protein DXT99_10600 [Pontibacter diazotrophicus]
MDTIKKLLPIDLYLMLTRVRNVNAPAGSAALLSTILYTFSFAHIFIGIVFYYLNTDLYFTYTEEDGYIEYFTAILILATSVLCFYKASFMEEKLPMLFFYALAVVFFLGFGEEISWGQRIFGFATPGDLGQINAQNEFNLHNIHLDGVNLNKLIFGKLLYTCVFIYFIGFPVFYRRKQQFRNLIDKFSFPVPTTTQSLIYFLAFFSILLIRDGEKWELQEFALASFLFFAFLFPANKKTERQR